MGILAEQRDKDVEALTWVAARSFHAWDDFKRSHSRPDGYQIQLNDALIPALSDLGTKIHHRHFPAPTMIDRIATLVVVANCFPFFTLAQEGRIVTAIRERRFVFARLTCAFVCAGLWLFHSTDSDGNAGFYKFCGFQTPDKGKRFHALLELLDPAEIKTTSRPGGETDERTFRRFARDILSVANFLENEIVFQRGNPENTSWEIDFGNTAE